jgi:hypothetical protein
LRRNCLLKHVIEGKTEWTRRRRRRFEQLLDDLGEREDITIWKKTKTLDRTLWRYLYGPVAREAMNE